MFKSNNRWSAFSITITTTISIPLIVILSSLFLPPSENWQHILDNLIWSYISDTITLVLLVVSLSSVFGISCAWLCTNFDFPLRKILSLALVLPLAAPGYVIAYVYADLFEFSGPIHDILQNFGLLGKDNWPISGIRTLLGASVILSFVLYPYIYVLCRTSFSQSSKIVTESSRILGISTWHNFFMVSLPLARPAIFGGIALVAMETIADFGVAEYFGIQSFTVGIFRTWLSLGDKQSALQLSSSLFFIICFLVLLERISRKGNVSNPVFSIPKNESITKLGYLGWFATSFCLLPVIFGFIIPIISLTILSFQTGDPLIGKSFIGYIQNTFLVAGLAATVATIAAIFLVYSERINPTKWIKRSIQLSTLGYALPGAVVGLGTLVAFSWIDVRIGRLSINIFNYNTGLLLTGSIFALVFAYVVRFLTISYNTFHSGIEKINPKLDDSAQTLGLKPLKILSKIHLPLIWPSILSGWFLVFIETTKELPATLMLRPFNFETLASRVYRLASDEKISEASSASLIIIFLGIMPITLLVIKGLKK